MNDPVIRTLARLATVLTLGVIVLGAFVRLSDAGLGCPDWPTCYGKATWPRSEAAIATANEAFPERPVELPKAWKEQVHRHAAAVLGVLVLALALRSNWRRSLARNTLFAAAAAAAIGTVLYMRGHSGASVTFSVLALGLPLLVAWRPGQSARPWARYSAVLLTVIMFQAMLGMWTVTWKLKPVVVMAHLMGGLTVLCLLAWLALRSGPSTRTLPGAYWLRPWLWLGFAVLAAQIALGGWTSANYAALACPDFPTCLGQWWPQTDFAEAFVLWRGIGVDYEGGILDGTARATIHLSHRIGAIVASSVLLVVVAALLRIRGLRCDAAVLVGLLAVQIALGISNVVFGLPLAVATAHNGVAALLLAQLVRILSRVSPVRG
ncbi:MAG: COX15/CtaA family protein [Xanthomonadales bacterium]|nr:COX15/CtaA family protein [Xanthomonadales bacterium]